MAINFRAADGLNETPVSAATPLPVTGVVGAGGIADGGDVAEGAKADAAATDSTSSWSVIALLKGLFAKQGYSAAVSMTRTNDTNAYAANDVLGAATGATAALTFTSMGPSAKEIIITSVALEIDRNAVVSGETSYVLHLYNVTPPSALGDNVAFDLPSGDRASYLGVVNLGTPIDLGSTLYVEANGLNKQVLLAGTSLFGYLVTVGAYTPAAQTVHKVTIHTIAP